MTTRRLDLLFLMLIRPLSRLLQLHLSSPPKRAMSSTVLKDLATAITKLTPLVLAEAWDNVGVMVEAPEPRRVDGVQKIVTCIDCESYICF